MNYDKEHRFMVPLVTIHNPGDKSASSKVRRLRAEERNFWEKVDQLRNGRMLVQGDWQPICTSQERAEAEVDAALSLMRLDRGLEEIKDYENFRNSTASPFSVEEDVLNSERPIDLFLNEIHILIELGQNSDY